MQRNLFNFKIEKKSEAKGEDPTVYAASASTIDIDRDGEIVVPYGVDLKLFELNPLLLGFHDRRSWPIGKVKSVDVSETEVAFDFEFANTEEGRKAEYLYNNGFMNSFSIGFKINEYLSGPFEADVIELDYSRGKIKLPVKKYKGELWGIISKWELREISAVTVPANPYANLKKSLVYKALDEPPERADLILKQIDRFIADLDASAGSALEISHVITHDAAPDVSEETTFDGPKMLAKWARQCSAKNSGRKEDIDWMLYRQGFAAMNPAAVGALKSYYFLHHFADGSVSLPAVKFSLADLLIENGKADLPEEFKRAAYDHLITHLPPEIIPEYKALTPEEAESLRTGTVSKDSTEDPDPPASVSLSPDVMDLLRGLKSSMDEMSEDLVALNLSMSIMEEKMQLVMPEKSIEFNTAEDTGGVEIEKLYNDIKALIS